MVNTDIVFKLLLSIEGFVSDLRAADDITYDRFITDIRAQRFVERTLQISVEACIDLTHHIISDERWREPSSYADAFMVLAENGVITSEQVKKYALMARFRNKIVHFYESIDPEQVFAIFKNHISDFDDFVATIRKWISKEESYYRQ